MSKRRKTPSLEAVFRGLSPTMKSAVSDEESPLRIGLATLALAAERCGIEHLSVPELVRALEYAGISVNPLALTNAFSRGGNRLSSRQIEGVTKYKAMLLGVKEVRDLIGEGNIDLVYIEAGQPRTARKKLTEVLSDSQGIVRISDPYFGERTLDALEAISKNCEARFLTARITGNEAKLRRLTSDLQTERANLAIRVYPNPAELHDRYVHSDSKLVIVGHGLKDIGNKESFVIIVDRVVAGDLIDTIRAAFDVKWGVSVAF